MRVLSLVTLPTLGAGNRLRIEQYGEYLRTEGIELAVSAFFDDRGYRVLYRPGHLVAKVFAVLRGIWRRVRDLARVRSFDVVLVYRESAPIGPPLFERVLGLLRIPYVFDFDDAIFLGPIHPSNRRWAWLRHPSRVAETTRGACAVIVGNEYLAQWAERHNGRVTIISTAVDVDRHRPYPRPPGGPVIGWVGSSTTAPYLALLDEPLRVVAEHRPEVRLRLIGGRYAHPSMPTEEVAYDLEREPLHVSSFDIGVLPEPDDEWTRGKGAFKALIYMAAGLPVVASHVGVNPDIVVDGVTGYCVTDDAGWIDALERLIADPELRARLGRNGRARVEEMFSTRVQGPRLAAVLRHAADANRRVR